MKEVDRAILGDQRIICVHDVDNEIVPDDGTNDVFINGYPAYMFMSAAGREGSDDYVKLLAMRVTDADHLYLLMSVLVTVGRYDLAMYIFEVTYKDHACQERLRKLMVCLYTADKQEFIRWLTHKYIDKNVRIIADALGYVLCYVYEINDENQKRWLKNTLSPSRTPVYFTPILWYYGSADAIRRFYKENITFEKVKDYLSGMYVARRADKEIYDIYRSVNIYKPLGNDFLTESIYSSDVDFVDHVQATMNMRISNAELIVYDNETIEDAMERVKKEEEEEYRMSERERFHRICITHFANFRGSNEMILDMIKYLVNKQARFEGYIYSKLLAVNLPNVFEYFVSIRWKINKAINKTSEYITNPDMIRMALAYEVPFTFPGYLVDGGCMLIDRIIGHVEHRAGKRMRDIRKSPKLDGEILKIGYEYMMKIFAIDTRTFVDMIIIV